MPDLHYSQFKGAVYDVDDTLLDNQAPAFRPYNIHEHSRHAAIRQVGQELNIEALLGVSHEQNAQAFLNAKEHSVEGALLHLIAELELLEDVIPHKELIEKIVALKAELHKELLVAHGVEVKGASAFVKRLGTLGMQQAIASGAIRPEIDLFLEKYQLASYFPDQRIIAKADFKRPKPHPESFELAFASLQLPAGTDRMQVLAFEDDPKGVESARRAGLFVCALTTRFPKEKFEQGDYLPRLVAANFDEYADIFKIR